MKKLRRSGQGIILLTMLAILAGCAGNSRMVRVSSDPSGAKVYLNDSFIGETPFDTMVRQRQGDYNVYAFEAVKEGCKPEKKAFKEQFYHQTAADVVPEKLHFVLVGRERHSIAITSAPEGAQVTLNGEGIGETPCTVTIWERLGEPRIFDFVAEKEGYAQDRKVLREAVPREDGAAFEFPKALHFTLTAEAPQQQ